MKASMVLLCVSLLFSSCLIESKPQNENPKTVEKIEVLPTEPNHKTLLKKKS